jgi:hypothetical protein
MLVESSLLFLNVLLCAFIVSSIVRRKPFKRTLHNRLTEVYQRWTAGDSPRYSALAMSGVRTPLHHAARDGVVSAQDTGPGG